MSKISPKTLLNKNTKKEFDIEEINLDNISMNDLNEGSKNYFILKSLLDLFLHAKFQMLIIQ